MLNVSHIYRVMVALHHNIVPLQYNAYHRLHRAIMKLDKPYVSTPNFSISVHLNDSLNLDYFHFGSLQQMHPGDSKPHQKAMQHGTSSQIPHMR